MNEIEIRQMTREDIPAICQADNDETESFVVYLNAEYGPAQRFYALRGYVPDGAGVYYEERVLPKDEACKNDDELTLCLVKELS